MTLREAMKLRAQIANSLTPELEVKDPVLFTVASSMICALDRFAETCSEAAKSLRKASVRRKALN